MGGNMGMADRIRDENRLALSGGVGNRPFLICVREITRVTRQFHPGCDQAGKATMVRKRPIVSGTCAPSVVIVSIIPDSRQSSAHRNLGVSPLHDHREWNRSAQRPKNSGSHPKRAPALRPTRWARRPTFSRRIRALNSRRAIVSQGRGRRDSGRANPLAIEKQSARNRVVGAPKKETSRAIGIPRAHQVVRKTSPS